MAKTRDDLLALAKRQYTEHDGFRIQSLTELETIELEGLWHARYKQTGEIDLRMRSELIVRCLVDENGSRLFSDDEWELIGGLPPNRVKDLHQACQDFNDLFTGRDDVTDTEKKSEGAQD